MVVAAALMVIAVSATENISAAVADPAPPVTTTTNSVTLVVPQVLFGGDSHAPVFAWLDLWPGAAPADIVAWLTCKVDDPGSSLASFPPALAGYAPTGVVTMTADLPSTLAGHTCTLVAIPRDPHQIVAFNHPQNEIRDNLNSIYVRGAAVRVVDPGTTPY
ncbi:MAG: hypothetical protein JWQ64_639 [Subtercola sp.]|nr:hypothetical protein [Subtercola sp.]